MTQVEPRWPESSYFLLLLRHVARAVTVGSCLHETVSAVRCLCIAHSETYGFNQTRRSLAALPLKVESIATFGPVFLLLESSGFSKLNEGPHVRGFSIRQLLTVVMKNCEPLVSFPALAMDSMPAPVCLSWKFSSGNVRP